MRDQGVLRDDSTGAFASMCAGTTFFLHLLDDLSPTALDGPSALPGWSRRHVAAHVARNAEALSRLLDWARTGTETPMYPSPTDRNAQIEASSRQAAPVLVADVHDTAAALTRALQDLPAAAAQAVVRNAQDREIQAAVVPWLRAREVWLHAVDLDAGGAVTDLPAAFLTELVEDVTASFRARPELPPLHLTASDAGRSWLVKDGPERLDVTGTTAELVGWLVGRSSDAPLRPRPVGLVLPPWL